MEPQDVHGGSIRYFVCHEGNYPVEQSVKEALGREKKLALTSVTPYHTFRKKCEASKRELVTLLTRLRSEGKKVMGYAATSKSTTVLNYCGIGPSLLPAICDTTPLKQGKFSPGMHIPVVPYEEFEMNHPDYALLFAWNHQKEIFAKETGFRRQGGQWIVFVPEVKILE